jgi:hypothetical protein
VVSFLTTESDYDNWLPSVSAAFHITDNAVVRGAASRTMTRPNPNTMLPGLNFSSPSADAATIGNPALDPYLSTNFDLGFEYYTGQGRLCRLHGIPKGADRLHRQQHVTAPFASLAQFGVTYNTLSPTQQAAINSRTNGNNVANVGDQRSRSSSRSTPPARSRSTGSKPPGCSRSISCSGAISG